MKRFCVTLFACALLLGAAAERTRAQAGSPDRTPPSYDMKAQALLDLADMEKKFVSLAQAIPARDYAWRPGPGVVPARVGGTSAAGIPPECPPRATRDLPSCRSARRAVSRRRG